jgi:hypothetical protein
LTFTEAEWTSLVIARQRAEIPGVVTHLDLDRLANETFGAEGADKLRSYGRALAKGMFVANTARTLTHTVFFIVTPSDQEKVDYVKMMVQNVVPVWPSLTNGVLDPGKLDFEGGRVDVVMSSEKCENRMALWR